MKRVAYRMKNQQVWAGLKIWRDNMEECKSQARAEGIMRRVAGEEP